MSRGVFKAHRNVKNLRSYLNLTICVTNRKKIPEKPSFRRGDSYRKVSKNPKAFKFVHKGIYPPKGRLLADSCRGPIVFTYVSILG